jgi:hypothetical protein
MNQRKRPTLRKLVIDARPKQGDDAAGLRNIAGLSHYYIEASKFLVPGIDGEIKVEVGEFVDGAQDAAPVLHVERGHIVHPGGDDQPITPGTDYPLPPEVVVVDGGEMFFSASSLVGIGYAD